MGLFTAFIGAKFLGRVLQILAFLTVFFVILRIGDYMFDFHDGSKIDIMGTVIIAFIFGALTAYFGFRLIRDYGVALIGLVGGASLTLMAVTPLDINIHIKYVACTIVGFIAAFIGDHYQNTIKLVGTGIIGSALTMQGLGSFLGGFPSLSNKEHIRADEGYYYYLGGFVLLSALSIIYQAKNA